jgi:hypothetical protein
MAPEHDVVYAKASVVHRPGCPRADGQVQALAVAGEVLWREYAPATCWHCRPVLHIGVGQNPMCEAARHG